MGQPKKFNFIFMGMGSRKRILSRLMVDLSLEGHVSNKGWSRLGRRESRVTSGGTVKSSLENWKEPNGSNRIILEK